jgi:hypothetical protein
MHLMDVHRISMYPINVYPIGAYPIGVDVTGIQAVNLGVHLRGGWWCDMVAPNGFDSADNFLAHRPPAASSEKFPLCDCGDENDLLGPSFSRQGLHGD